MTWRYNCEQKQTQHLNFWSLVSGGREKPLNNYKNKCKTTTDISTTKKEHRVTRGSERGCGRVTEAHTALHRLLGLSDRTSLVSGHFLTYSLYLNNLRNMKYAMMLCLISKSFGHNPALLKLSAPLLTPAGTPRGSSCLTSLKPLPHMLVLII